MTLHYSYKYNYNCNSNYTTLHYTTLKLQLQLRYTICIPLHYNNYTTPQLQLQLRYTTLHPAVVGEVTDQVTTATIATTPKNTAPTTFGSISGFALRSVIHNNQPLL